MIHVLVQMVATAFTLLYYLGTSMRGSDAPRRLTSLTLQTLVILWAIWS